MGRPDPAAQRLLTRESRLFRRERLRNRKFAAELRRLIQGGNRD